MDNEWTQEDTNALAETTGSLADTVIRLRAELEATKALLRRWCEGFEEIDRGSLCQVYDETEKFLAECEKEAPDA